MPLLYHILSDLSRGFLKLFSRKLRAGRLGRTQLLPTVRHLRGFPNSRGVPSPWRPYCITTWAICQAFFSGAVVGVEPTFSKRRTFPKLRPCCISAFFVGGSPFYLTAICAPIVSYFKGFVKRFLRFSLIFFKGETNAAWLLPLSLLLRKVGVLTSPWHQYITTSNRRFQDGIMHKFGIKYLCKFLRDFTWQNAKSVV